MFRILIAFLLLIPNLAVSQSTDYGSVRMLDGWKTSSGAFQVALEFNLNPGWKTYWRAPGPAGIPPQFNWAGSRNIGGVAIQWPTPQVFDTAGLKTVGYKDTFVLPILIDPQQDGPIRVALSLQFGVCSDICIPAEAVFLGRIDGSNIEGEVKIRAALSTQPMNQVQSGLQNITCRIAPAQRGFTVETDLRFARRVEDPMVVIEYNDPDIWVSQASVSQQGRRITAISDMRYYGAGAAVISRENLRVTVFSNGTATQINGCAG